MWLTPRALHRYKEAINECTSALETQPSYHKALLRRAKAYEQIGHYKSALGDVHLINRGEGATPETEVREEGGEGSPAQHIARNVSGMRREMRALGGGVTVRGPLCVAKPC